MVEYFYFLRRRKNTTENIIKINNLDSEDKFKKFLSNLSVKAPDSSVYQTAYDKVFGKPKKVKVSVPVVETVEVEEVKEENEVEVDNEIKPETTKKRGRRRSRKKSTTP
jgi:hypothetical protein